MLVSSSADGANTLLSSLSYSNANGENETSTVINATTPSEINRVIGGLQQVSGNSSGMALGSKLGMKKRSNDKKTCRWVLDNGTICGRSFSKFDSLRRHVQELHKGVRPFVCNMCNKSYGRKDYLDRHIKSHTTSTTTAITVATSESKQQPQQQQPQLMVTSNEVLASLEKDSGAVILDEDDDMKGDLMGGDVVTVVGAVDDEDDDLAV